MNLGSNAIEIIATLPSLRNRWVAIDPRGVSTNQTSPLKLALPSGAVVVDADQDLEALCARVKAAKQTSLTILYAGRRRNRKAV